jgi:phosphoribosylglycinamide formyltransferase-1
VNKKSLVVLISGSGSNLQAIIDAVASKQINASISAVISNRPSAYGLERATKANIKTIVIDHAKFTQREDFDAALSGHINDLKPNLIALAGFMRILSDDFVEQYKGKILNIHPSLLPKFKGLHTHRCKRSFCR